jgi:hypothetical protein
MEFIGFLGLHADYTGFCGIYRLVLPKNLRAGKHGPWLLPLLTYEFDGGFP